MTVYDCIEAREEIIRQIKFVELGLKSGFPQDYYLRLLKAYNTALEALDFIGGRL